MVTQNAYAQLDVAVGGSVTPSLSAYVQLDVAVGSSVTPSPSAYVQLDAAIGGATVASRDGYTQTDVNITPVKAIESSFAVSSIVTARVPAYSTVVTALAISSTVSGRMLVSHIDSALTLSTTLSAGVPVKPRLTSEISLDSAVSAYSGTTPPKLDPDYVESIGLGLLPVDGRIGSQPFIEAGLGIVDEVGNQIVDEDGNTLIWS